VLEQLPQGRVVEGIACTGSVVGRSRCESAAVRVAALRRTPRGRWCRVWYDAGADPEPVAARTGNSRTFAPIVAVKVVGMDLADPPRAAAPIARDAHRQPPPSVWCRAGLSRQLTGRGQASSAAALRYFTASVETLSVSLMSCRSTCGAPLICTWPCCRPSTSIVKTPGGTSRNT
jgi:hypothetical protein